MTTRALTSVRVTGYVGEWNYHYRNWNLIALGILYRSRNWIGIAFIGIGIELQKRN